MNDTVRVVRNKAVYFTYSIRDESGEILEQSDLPIGYVHGTDSGLVEKVEMALEGMAAGETVEVPVSPEEGFGAADPDLTYTDDLANVPPEYHRVGAEVQFQNDQGDVKTFIVSSIEDGKLTVDGNHPLAGKNLIFSVKVTEVREATPDELQSKRLEDNSTLLH